MANKVSFIIQLKDKFSGVSRGVELQMRKMERGARRTNRALEAQQKKFKGLRKQGKRLAAQGAVATAAITAPILLLANSMTNAASEATETANKFNQVFDTVENKANQVADSFSKNFGVAGSTARKMIGDTGDLLVGFGFTGDAALEMSGKVARLASDLTSFQNFAGGAEAANVALTKALLGESESAKALGIVVRQGTPEFKRNVKIIMRSRRVNLLQAKAIEILRIATSQSKKAVGDVSRTWDDHASVVRRSREATKEMSESFGRLLIPMATKLTRVVTGVVKWLTNLSPPMKTLIIAVGGFLAIGGPLLILLGGIAFAVSAISAPVLLVGAAILGLGVVIAAIALNWDNLVKFFLRGASQILGVMASIAGFVGIEGLQIDLNRASSFLLEQAEGKAPTAPVTGGNGTLAGQIVVTAEGGAAVRQTTMQTVGAGLDIGMNVAPAGA